MNAIKNSHRLKIIFFINNLKNHRNLVHLRSCFIKNVRNKSPYIIGFASLPVGEHVFEFMMDDAFTKTHPIDEISQLNAQTSVTLEKMNNVLKATIKIDGHYDLICDRCDTPFTNHFNVNEDLFIRHGIATGDEPDNIVMLPENVLELDLEPYLYEFIALSVPKRKVHADGDCDPSVIEKLKELSVSEAVSETDPRWNILKNVKF